VDGERDTPAVMKAFLEPLGPGFLGLTGDPRIVRDIATDFSAVFFKGMPTDAAGGYDVEHTSQVYLVDREGRLRATFYNAPVGDMVAVTRGVLREQD
jgi:protein SCO1